MSKFKDLMMTLPSYDNAVDLMHKVTDIIDKYLCELEEEDIYKYNEIMDELLAAIMGPHFDEDTAKKAVSMFVNDDGTIGEHWAIKDTTGVAESEGITFDKFTEADWYYVLNLMYSDYYSTIGSNIPLYVSLAKNWIMDKDAPAGKAYKYWQMISA